MGYSGQWLSTDQVPRRAVESGQIDRFGLIDPGPRGRTDRYSLSAEFGSKQGLFDVVLDRYDTHVVERNFATPKERRSWCWRRSNRRTRRSRCC